MMFIPLAIPMVRVTLTKSTVPAMNVPIAFLSGSPELPGYVIILLIKIKRKSFHRK